MSKLSREQLCSCIRSVLDISKSTTSGFLDLVTIQIALRKHDPHKFTRYAGAPESFIRVCILGDEKHCDEAALLKVPFVNLKQLQLLQDNKTLVRRLAHRYDAFLASKEILEVLPVLVGPAFDKAGKCPTLLTHEESMEEKINELKETIKIRLDKLSCFTMIVGHAEMGVDELADNIIEEMDLLTAILKRSWNNVHDLTIKSSSGIEFELH
ncbi:60S ribosomal protein L10a-like [Bicyclus anynana]|uniref:60S ribosomal protein L10a-like n=1 Tax=Bicyclus anynana TaxID=110368 RepID=A0A6J1N4I6_BICAN|nr:60S ribosomal protein L10a-like [Bicyclus anynana]